MTSHPATPGKITASNTQDAAADRDASEASATQATETRRPTEAAPRHPEKDDGEEILVREEDGRYRIVGRRPRRRE